jgi:hypothetical protein
MTALEIEMHNSSVPYDIPDTETMIQLFLDKKINIWTPNEQIMLLIDSFCRPYGRGFGIPGYKDQVRGRKCNILRYHTYSDYIKCSDEYSPPPKSYGGLPVYIYMGNREDMFQC